MKYQGLKLWLLLFSAFAIVGGGTCYFAYQGAVSRYQSNLKNKLEDIAKLGALQVNTAAHSKLQSSEDMETELYRSEIKRLADVQNSIESIRYIYTIRQDHGKLFFVLDPTPPGDHDNDGIDDKSYLMDPYESDPSPVLQVLQTGRATSDNEFQTDRWGTFISGFAPIKDSEGKTVAVLGVDVEASRIQSQWKGLAFVMASAYFFMLVLGGIVSLYISTHIMRWSSSQGPVMPEKVTAMGSRTTILQLFLATSVITCIAVGIFCRTIAQNDSKNYSNANERINRLLQASSNLQSVTDSSNPSPADLSKVAKSLSSVELAHAQSQIKQATELLVAGSPEWKTLVYKTNTELRDRLNTLQGLQADIGIGLIENQESFNLLFSIAALLALGSLVLVRSATLQQDLLAKTALRAQRLHEEVEVKNTEIEATNTALRHTLEDLQDNFEAMVQAWVKAVEAKDVYTAGHSERVMRYSMAIGSKLNLSDNDMRILEMGTLIHDIGKIGIPDHILTKPSKLTEEEFQIIQSHPDVGYRMVANIPLFRDCAPIILWHHEKLNGTGYPDGLKGDEIPLLVRIATVSDMFDAMTSTRAYRVGLSADEALGILQKDAEKDVVDPKIVAILTEIVNEQGVLWQPRIQDAA